MYNIVNWFIGVVEDRNDPIKIGRVRVRCFGYHDEDLLTLPTADLPWAQPIQGITSAATSGVGFSATGLVEGSWVVGFFLDPPNNQRPAVMGSLGGLPLSARGEGGFRDPAGKYPRTKFLDEPDTPRLARGEGEAQEDAGLVAKRKNRTTGVHVAVGPHANTVIPAKGLQPPDPKSKIRLPAGVDLNLDIAESDVVWDHFYRRKLWSEPLPRTGGGIYPAEYNKEREPSGKEYHSESSIPSGVTASTYPFNHVHVSEAGHVNEIDDTPGSPRLHRQHAIGTFEEWQPDGTRVQKVVGDNFEIVVNDESILIRGNQRITVSGSQQIYTQGDFIHEVDGNYMLTVKGDRVTKVVGTDAREVGTDDSKQIDGNKYERVSGNKRETTDKNYHETIGLNHVGTVKKNDNWTVHTNQKLVVQANSSSTTSLYQNIGVGKNLNVGATLNVRIKAGKNIVTDSGVNSKHSIGANNNLTAGEYTTHTAGKTITITSGSVPYKIDMNP